MNQYGKLNNCLLFLNKGSVLHKLIKKFSICSFDAGELLSTSCRVETSA